MIDIDKWQEIYQTLSKHKLRTALTALGVFWGIFMLMILLGAGTGLENGVTGMFGGLSKNAVFVWPRKTTEPYKGYQPGRQFSFTIDDDMAIRTQIPETGLLAARLRAGTNITIYGQENGSFDTMGDMPEFVQIEGRDVYKGRFINLKDIEQKRKVAVIGERVKEVLFKEDEEALGEFIKIRGSYYKVVGVFKSLDPDEESVDQEQTIHIPITTAQQITNRGNRISWFAMTPQSGIKAEILENKVKRLLAKRHTIAPNDKAAFGSANVEEEFKQFQNVFGGIRAFTWFVGILTMVAGVVGISNIMLISVKERTREIGLRKALGATPWSINIMLIQESVLLTAIAGYAGLVVGVGIIEGISYLMTTFEIKPQFFGNPEIQIGTALSAIVLLVITGTLAGLIPASQAASIRPIEALRTE